MRITVLPSSVETPERQFAASYLVNDTVVIDAGSIGFADVARQQRVRAVFLSHLHLDHIASLPIFIDNVYRPGPSCPTVFASPTVIDGLKSHFFNDTVWPDVTRLSREESPFVRFVAIEARKPIETEGFVITPIELNHIVPTFGFIIDDGRSAVAIVSDTGPTVEVWEAARANPRLKAVFLESAFPNNMDWLAERARHLTPSLFRQEYAKLGSELPVIVIHVKPAFYDAVIKELHDLNLPSLIVSKPDLPYEY